MDFATHRAGARRASTGLLVLQQRGGCLVPRPRKPTAVLEANGAFAKNPQRKRARAGEPVDTRPIGEPPAYFDAVHVEAWHEVCAQSPPGVLGKSDALILEMTVRLLVRMRRSPAKRPKWLGALGAVLSEHGWTPNAVEEFKDTVHDALKITPGELRVLNGCLVSLGLTPRSRIQGHGESEEPDPLDRLLAKMRAN